MSKILLIGAGGHAYSSIGVIEMLDDYKIAGVVDNYKSSDLEILGYKIIGKDSDIPRLRKKFNNAIITIGQIKTAKTRKRLFNILKKEKFNLPTIISPRAYVSSYSNIDEGTIIMHDVIINSNARIGKNCIINNKALIEHDVFIGDHCHISTGALLNGDVIIGNQTFIGSGVVTKESITIGDNCVIGAGVILKTNVKSGAIIKN